MAGQVEALERRTLLAASLSHLVDFGTGQVTVSAVRHDAAGNVYLAGAFLHQVDFDPRSGHTTVLDADAAGPQSQAPYLAKYTSAGRLVWARLPDMSPDAFAVGADGAAYLAQTAGASVRVEKLNARGRFVWAATAAQNHLAQDPLFGAAAAASAPAGLAVSPRGDLAVTGGQSYFDRTDGSLAFVSLLSGADGHEVATRNLGGHDASGDAVAALPDGSFAVAGTVDLSGRVSSGDDPRRHFVAKLGPDLGVLWRRQIGGPVAGHVEVASDPDGSVYVSGAFRGRGAFSRGLKGVIDTETSSVPVVYVAKYDGADRFQWVTSVEVEDPPAGDWQMTAHPTGGVVVSTTLSGVHDLGPGRHSRVIDAGARHRVVVTRLDRAGSLVDAFMFGSRGGRAWGRPVVSVGPRGGLAVAGMFSGTIDFDPGTGVVALAAGDRDEAYLSLLEI